MNTENISLSQEHPNPGQPTDQRLPWDPPTADVQGVEITKAGPDATNHVRVDGSGTFCES